MHQQRFCDRFARSSEAGEVVRKDVDQRCSVPPRICFVPRVIQSEYLSLIFYFGCHNDSQASTIFAIQHVNDWGGYSIAIGSDSSPRRKYDPLYVGFTAGSLSASLGKRSSIDSKAIRASIRASGAPMQK